MVQKGFLSQSAMQDELRNLFEGNPMGVAIMRHERRADGHVTARRVFANNSLADLFLAPSLEMLMQQTVRASWVDHSALERVNKAFSSQTRIVSFEAERIRFDGSILWVSMTSQPIVLGGEELTIVWHLDITDRKQAEQDLQASETQLRDFIDSSVDWFWEMDADLRFTYMSPNVERIAGVPPEWHYGKTREDLLGPNYDRAVWTKHLQTLKARKPYRDFVFLRTGDGVEEKWLSSSGKPIFADDGNFLGYRGTGTDVTERIENQELRDASRAKSEFLSRMSHELRTPLNAIQGFGQLLENDPEHPLAPVQEVAVQQILQGGSHLLDLINQVLDMAKLENGALAPSIEPVDTSSVLRDCLTMAASMVDEKSVSIQTETPDGGLLPFVRADRMRLRQVLLNLLSNATKYNTDGGSITVSCRNVNSGMFRISIADTGRGIPKRYQDNIFSPFDRLASEGSQIEGTGLGLSITRDLVDSMEGNIGFSSEPGTGSTFWFDLPIATESEKRDWLDAQRQNDLSKSGKTFDFPSRKILYIEDNPANSQLMEMILGRVDSLSLRVVATAEAGIKMAQSERPDLILMDFNLPGMSGEEALKMLRRDSDTADIPIIAVSANAMSNRIDSALQAGFEAYITKPFEISAVMKTVAKVLGVEATGEEPMSSAKDKTSRQPEDFAPLAAKDVGILLAAAAAMPPEYIFILESQAAAIPAQVEKIKRAAVAEDAVAVVNATHNLKTNSATFGARKLWALAQDLEDLAIDIDMTETAKRAAEIETEYHSVCRIIDQLLSEVRPGSQSKAEYSTNVASRTASQG